MEPDEPSYSPPCATLGKTEILVIGDNKHQ